MIYVNCDCFVFFNILTVGLLSVIVAFPGHTYLHFRPWPRGCKT